MNTDRYRLIVVTIALLVLITSTFGQGPTRKPQDRIHRVENGLLPLNSSSPQGLAERMAFYKTPGVSIAVINNGRLEWARGYGVLEAGSSRSVTTATLFQACSISKPIAAMAALELVEQGRLDLDEDINKKLASWKMPENDFTKEQKVTLRRLLTHTAGTTVTGLRGYAADEQIPTLHQILEGVKPANSEAITVDAVPGTRWRYSGGGFIVLQQLLTDVLQKPFPEIMRELVLQKLQMKQSTYQQPLPQSLKARAASAHQTDGQKIKGDWFIYPEMASGGMWTTPSDLSRIVIELQQAIAGRSNRILSRKMANEMLSDQMRDFPVAVVSQRYGRPIRNQGLGFRLEGEGRSARFSHHGGNTGYRCFIVAYNHLGQGAIVMTNSDNGAELVQEIVRSIAKEYGWPDYPFGLT